MKTFKIKNSAYCPYVNYVYKSTGKRESKSIDYPIPDVCFAGCQYYKGKYKNISIKCNFDEKLKQIRESKK